MSDLIDRQDALYAIKTAEFGMEYEAVEQLPSAQPEIIRCKDCKWSEHWDRWLLCGAWEAKAVGEDDFCSDAERRTDG